MSVREKINKSPAIVVVAVLLVIGGAIYVLSKQMNTGAKLPTGTYYTTDDGKTFFSGPLAQLPPFSQDGSEAVKAHVFECDGKQFVGYLSKLRPEAKAAIEAHRAEMEKKPTQAPPTLMPALDAQRNGWLFKKPGDAKWTPGGAGFRFPVSCQNGQPASEAQL